MRQMRGRPDCLQVRGDVKWHPRASRQDKSSAEDKGRARRYGKLLRIGKDRSQYFICGGVQLTAFPRRPRRHLSSLLQGSPEQLRDVSLPLLRGRTDVASAHATLRPQQAVLSNWRRTVW
jgi:hypothetical protein